LRTHPVTPAEEARGKDAAVVDDQQVAGWKQRREVVKETVLVSAGIAMEVQHARTSAHRQRFLRNEFFRKMEVEVGDPHRFRLEHSARARSAQAGYFGLSAVFCLMVTAFLLAFISALLFSPLIAALVFSPLIAALLFSPLIAALALSSL